MSPLFTEEEITFRRMRPSDKGAILTFARLLSDHDLLFLRRDITRPEAIDEWLRDIASGQVSTILATAGEEIVGYATVHQSALRWSLHVAELRVVVAATMRGQGLGRRLIQEAFDLALSKGIEKMVAQMTVDQASAIAVFEELGFRQEAVLRDHVRDLEGQSHDLVVMSLKVRDFSSPPL